ncbi:MAG: sporulation transcriptional regulator SpoIIID [Lachnospiraceae bacterium]|nr:sporulation transcriptional regulator SpoIIID [Lachnospiraceae bacterium]
MKQYIEERTIEIANYIIENNATVRQAAKQFGVSKSTVHVVVTIWNGGMVRLFGWLNRGKVGALSGGNLGVFLV